MGVPDNQPIQSLSCEDLLVLVHSQHSRSVVFRHIRQSFSEKSNSYLQKTHCTPPAQQEPADRHSWRLAGDLVEHLAANETDIPLRSM